LSKPAQPTSEPGAAQPTAIELARLWNVSDRTIKTYRAKGAPLHDDAAMLEWAAGIHDLPKGMQTRIIELRRKAGSAKKPPAPGAATPADPYWVEFERSQREDANGGEGSHRSDSAHLAELKRLRDFALFKMKRAQASGDELAVAEASQQIKLIAPIVHDEELRALKLNRELGETVPVVEQDRTARALVYWQMRGADEFLAAAAKRVADGVSGGGTVTAEDVRKILEPLVIRKRVEEPWIRAAQSPSGVHLSPRIVESMRKALADFTEDGEALFDSIYGAALN
jgi:hypothetical protein